jgi:membrane associated rhomboid family serine protease
MPYFPLYDNVARERTAWVTYAVMLANVLAFLFSLTLGEAGRQNLSFHYGFVPARVEQLQSGKPLPIVVDRTHPQLPNLPVRQLIGTLPPDRVQIVTSWLTCMFLHGGWLHVIGNMWFMWVFARSVEHRLGHFWFGVFYLVVGLMATACHWLDDPRSVMPMIGASGALAGVLGAYVILFPRARVVTLLFLVVFFMIFDLPAIVVLGVWFFVQLFEAQRNAIGLSGGVAWWAHIGGFMAGMGLMLAFTSPDDEPETADDKVGDEDVLDATRKRGRRRRTITSDRDGLG